jgi:MoxR-like ATPase
VNVALTLSQPLLVTGAPGTGKTGLAASIAYELDLGKPLKFETKSNSVSRELFYTYDALGRFQAKETGLDASPIHYFTYNALGEAILRANAPEAVQRFLSKDFKHVGKQQSIVLIDEVDKAPRDFPNDLLNEIEHMYFRIPELGNVVISADPAMWPIVVITSNSEKTLPDPFLRRCIFYQFPFLLYWCLYVVQQMLGRANRAITELFYVGLIAYCLFAGLIIQPWRKEIEGR